MQSIGYFALGSKDDLSINLGLRNNFLSIDTKFELK